MVRMRAVMIILIKKQTIQKNSTRHVYRKLERTREIPLFRLMDWSGNIVEEYVFFS